MPNQHSGRNYADQVTVRFTFTDRITEAPEEWVLRCDNPGSQLDLAWLEQQLEAMGADPVSHEPRFSLASTRRHTSWGADATVIAIVIAISVDLLSDALKAGALGLAHQIANRIRRPDLPDRQLTEDEAIGRAKWFVEERRGTRQLEVVSVDAGDDRPMTICLRGDEGTVYTCELIQIGGLVSITRFRWEVAP